MNALALLVKMVKCAVASGPGDDTVLLSRPGQVGGLSGSAMGSAALRM
jgi:hypothetical protein